MQKSCCYTKRSIDDLRLVVVDTPPNQSIEERIFNFLVTTHKRSFEWSYIQEGLTHLLKRWNEDKLHHIQVPLPRLHRNASQWKFSPSSLNSFYRFISSVDLIVWVSSVKKWNISMYIYFLHYLNINKVCIHQ